MLFDQRYNIKGTVTNVYYGRRSHLMSSAPISGSSSPGLIPGQGHCVVFWGKVLSPIVPLSTQVYKWLPVILRLEGNPAMG